MPLFDIIKSMSAAEKRHFKLQAGSTEKGKLPKYVELFDIINKQAVPDDTAILKAGFNSGDKNFLNEKIDESLHILYLGKSIESKLKWLSENMERLFEREHWGELQKCIKKAKQLAKKHEKFLDWLQAIDWEKELLIKLKTSKNLYEDYEKLVSEETEVRQKLNEEIDYQNLRRQINMLRMKDIRLNKPENQAKFKQITDSALLQNNKTPHSAKAQANFFHLKAVVARYNKKTDEAYIHAQSLIDVFEHNKLFKHKHAIWYKSSLCLLSEICYVSGKLRQIPYLIHKIESMEGSKREGFKTVCLHGILYAISNLDKEKGEEYISKIKQLIEEDKGNIRDGRKLAFFYNIAVFYSIFNEWQKANKWLSKILTYKRTNDRRDLQYASRICSLVTQYELESDDMDNHIIAVAKYLKSNQQYTETNQHIIQAFRDLYKAINRKEQEPIWEGLQNFLAKKITEQSQTTRQLGLEELQIWCKAKLQNTTMAEIIRQEQ